MTDQSLPPQFVDDLTSEPLDSVPLVKVARPIRTPATMLPNIAAIRPAERTLSYWATIDKPLLILASILIAVGVMMVFSTTFDWSQVNFGSPTVKVIEHIRNVAIGFGGATVALLFGYRRLRNFAVPILLVAISFLIAVQLFGDDVFNARRTLIAGRFQPGESAELAMIIYMAAWLGSKNTRIRSLTYGLIPFAIIVGFVVGLVILQPDLSTAITIAFVCTAMFFLAGADLVQLLALMFIAGSGSILLISSGAFFYAEDRFGPFIASLTDITKADYHILQARIAFENGGWTGLGLGQSLQKFTGLPAPHTDSIFAVIGEELGLIGAGVVVLLYILFVARGFSIAQRATDSFGALLAAGVTVWVATKALLNIAVMLSLVPPTGITLPFISFGGSSLVTLMVGVGLLLSVQRMTLLRTGTRERKVDAAPNLNHSGRDRRSRLSSAGSR